MDTLLDILFIVLLVWGVFSIGFKSDSREVQQFIQMLLDELKK